MNARVSQAIAVALAGSAAWQAADAQAQQSGPLQEIIVTGTRLKDRTVLDSPVPVDVLSAEDIRASGALAGELGQALQALAPSFNFPRQSNSGGADHVRAAQLRGMSPDQVLVLVNGKRRHTSALVNLESKIGKGTTPVDFNAIPLNAIKRIEVLRDGAGAQYGSDAIAGVINVILDDAPSGGEASLTYGEQSTDFAPTDQTLHDGKTLVADLKYGIGVGDGGFLRGGVEYRDRDQTNRSGFDTIIFQAPDVPENLATQGHRNYAPGDGEAEDLAFWFNSRFPLTGDVNLYSFGTYSDRDSEGATFFRYPIGYPPDQNVYSVYPDGFRPVSLGDNQDVSLTVGVDGNDHHWDWTASATYGKNDFDYDLRNSINASLGAESPTHFHLGSYKFDQLTVNLDASREFEAALFGNALNVAIGAEYRREEFQTGAGDPASYAAGPFTDFAAGAQAGPGLTPKDEADTSRDVVSLYADFSSYVTTSLLLELAGRYEHYTDFGDAFAGKLSALWRLTDTFALRGAISNSFRAPSLSQISFRSTTTNFGEGGTLSQILTLPVDDPIARALGAQDLDPEKSANVSLGFTFAPSDNFNLAVDLFRIKLNDRITISERISGSDLTDFIEANFGVTGVDGVNFFTNAVDTKTEGVDVIANYSSLLGPGKLAVTAGYTYAKTTIEDVNATPDQLQALGFNDVLFGVEERNTLTDAAPKDKWILSFNWDTDHWSLLARGTEYGSATRVFNFGGGFEPEQTYGSEFQLDLEATYKFTKNFSLSLGGLNVLDNYPDLSSADINYAGNFPYDVLSPIGMNGAFFYGRARLTF